MSPKKIKKGSKTKAFSASKKLSNKDYVLVALTEALFEGDSDAFKEILSAHLEVVNKDIFYKKAGIPRRSLFRMLSPSGNPTLDNITKVMSALKEVA